MHEIYVIDGCKYDNPSIDYSNKDTYSEFQDKLIDFKTKLISDISSKTSKTYFKFGDGDFYFLNKKPKGSAKPGIRALKKPYFMINHKKFVEGSKQNDVYMSLITKTHSDMLQTYFKKTFDYPSEFVYGLIANKWITKYTTKNIGIIGADVKLEIINSLIQKQEYKEFLGIEKFSDYISIPQRFACDNLRKVNKSVIKQLEKSSSDLFLLGVGHVKSGMLHRLKEHSNAVFLDIGVGVDALAGIVNLTRPYFGGWTNYQLKNQSIYSEVDFLVNKINNIKNIKFI